MALIWSPGASRASRTSACSCSRRSFGLEVKGHENLPAAGTRAIIAPNHVSLLDAAIMHSLMPSHAAFAINTSMAQNGGSSRSCSSSTRTPSIRPSRWRRATLIQAVKGGETMVIFPEGRLTVTGGLMKVYDGTAMIADKADAIVIPVRIDGPERSHFGYLNRYQAKKALVPEDDRHHPAAARSSTWRRLRGKARRQAAGAALQDIMVDAAVKTANIDQTLFSALVEAKETRDTGKPIVEDPLGTKLSYRKLITARRCSAPSWSRWLRSAPASASCCRTRPASR